MNIEEDTRPESEPEPELELEQTDVSAPVVVEASTVPPEPDPPPTMPPPARPSAPPRLPPHQIAGMGRQRPAVLELRVTLPPTSQGCAYAFPQHLFRPERVEWEGPAEVIWLGRLQKSGFEPRLADVRGDRGWRVFLVGDPVCFVAVNQTTQPLELVLRVIGTGVFSGSAPGT